MAEENQVTTNVEETMRGPKEMTTKDPKKIEAGRRLAEYNCRKREELKAQKSKQVENNARFEHVLRHWGCSSCGGDSQVKVNNVLPPQQPSHPCPQTNKFETE